MKKIRMTLVLTALIDDATHKVYIESIADAFEAFITANESKFTYEVLDGDPDDASTADVDWRRG